MIIAILVAKRKFFGEAEKGEGAPYRTGRTSLASFFNINILFITNIFRTFD